MVCSKEDSWKPETKMDSRGSKGPDQDSEANIAIDILTPEGKTLKLSLGDNTDIRKIKIECELLCGIPSDLQLIQLQRRDLSNDSTLSSLSISDGCTMTVTIPQWWQKFVTTCYRADTQQVRKRIYVKMNQVSREERSFTAAFIAAVKGNHNLMFAAFAGRKINLHSKTKLSGRNLLHAAVFGGSTSCVANVLMNGGNALLEAPDNTGETPVNMAKKLYGEDGSMVKFLNVYLELHRRETKHSGFSNRYWDNLEEDNNNTDLSSPDNEENSDHEDLSKSRENLITDLRDLKIHHAGSARTYSTENEFLANNSKQEYSSVTTVNITNYDAGHNSSVVSSDVTCKTEVKQENNTSNSGSVIRLSYNGQSYAQTTDTGYCSSYNQSGGTDIPELFWNEDLFAMSSVATAQPEHTKQELKLGEQTVSHAIEGDSINMSISSADPSGDHDSDTSRSSKPRRRAQLGKLVFLEQKRKRSTTERTNLEDLMKMNSDSMTKESQDREQTEGRKSESHDDEKQITASREKENDPNTACDVINVPQGKECMSAVSSSIHDPIVSSSPKPPRRAQLRKKSIIEQRRKRSMVDRPNIEELDSSKQDHEGCNNHEEHAENNSNKTTAERAGCTSSNDLEGNTEGMSSGVQEHRVTECNTRVDVEQKGHLSVHFQQHIEGPKEREIFEDESPVAKYVLNLWQDQAREAEKAILSGEESDTARSPKLVRRAFRRKQAYMEQRRKKSATERPNIIKLMSRNMDDDADASRDVTDMASENNDDSKLPGAQNNLSASLTNQKDTTSADTPEVYTGNNASVKEHFSVDWDTPQSLSRTLATGERIPIRTAQRCPNNGTLLDGRAKKTCSSVSGEESSGSDREQEKIIKETVTPMNNLTKTGRRRCLPSLTRKRIKLPVIKIEGSESPQGPVSIKAPHPPLGRSRSGSTCSEDSVSSVEMPSEGKSEDEIARSAITKRFPIKQRRKSVPNSPFNFEENPPIFRTRKNSVQVEEIEEQGFGVSPQLRARLQLRDQPRERLPWNEWRTKARSGSLPGKNSENSAVQYMQHKELSEQNVRVVAWNEKQRPQTARHGTSRMSFTEWLDRKEALAEKTRPVTAGIRRQQDRHKEDLEWQKSKKYEDWLVRKDLEALEHEEMLRTQSKIKFQRTHKNK